MYAAKIGVGVDPGEEDAGLMLLLLMTLLLMMLLLLLGWLY